MKIGNYSDEEVDALLDGWQELMELRHKDFINVRMMDVMNAFKRMPEAYKTALFWCGIAGLSTKVVADMYDRTPKAMRLRYLKGIDWLLMKLNG